MNCCSVSQPLPRPLHNTSKFSPRTSARPLPIPQSLEPLSGLGPGRLMVKLHRVDEWLRLPLGGVRRLLGVARRECRHWGALENAHNQCMQLPAKTLRLCSALTVLSRGVFFSSVSSFSSSGKLEQYVQESRYAYHGPFFPFCFLKSIKLRSAT